MLVNIIKKNIGTGNKNGTSINNITTTKSSPAMLPKSLIVSDNGLAKWLMISIISINGASAGNGPKKCLMYDAPCF